MQPKQIFVGTSGWTYDDWSERFYPREVKGSDRLTYYAKHFNTVEVNASFYRIPTEAMIAAWNRRLEEAFHLVLKGSRAVTHLRKLDNCAEPLDMFLDRVLKLSCLKVILWQLPPSLHMNLDRLEHFLSALPRQVRHAVEFRHKSWWHQDTPEVLSKHNAAFVAVSHPKLPGDFFVTTDLLYIRFHGEGRETYRYNYSREELLQWASRVEPHLEGRTLYAFFNNDYHAYAVENAKTFQALLSQRHP